MHPIILFDARRHGDLEKARLAAPKSCCTASTSVEPSPESTA